MGVVPLLLATIMGYCVTGYIRDELYSNNIKRCIGPCCSFFVSDHVTCSLCRVTCSSLPSGDATHLYVSVTMGTGGCGSWSSADCIC